MKNNWQIKKLGDICEVFNGKTPSRVEQRKEGYPVLKIKNIGLDGELTRFESFVDEKFFNGFKNKVLQKGDILILNAAHISSYVGSKKYYWDKDLKNILPTGEWTIIRARDWVTGYFIYLWILSLNGDIAIRTVVRGIHLYPKDIANLSVKIPDEVAKKQIVEKLNAIRKLQELNNKEIEKAEELFKSLLKQRLLLRDKLTPLIDITEINPTVKIDKSKPVPFISMADVDGNMGKVVNISYKENKELGSGARFENGDVLFARITPCTENGKTALVSGLNIQGMGSTEFYVLRARKDKAIPYFIYLLTRTDWFKQHAIVSMTGTSGRQRVPKSFLENILVPMVSLSDQRSMQIAFSKLQEYQMSLSERKSKLLELFESTLNKEMRGKLVN